MKHAVRDIFDPKVAGQSRSTAALMIAVALLLIVAGALGHELLPGLFLGASMGLATGGVVLHLHRVKETLLDESRHLWGLTGAMLDGRPWPAPGGWALGADAMGHLVHELRRRHPSTIVELGPGASSVILGRCFPEAAMFGLEHDLRYVGAVAALLESHGLRNYHLIHAPITPPSDDGSPGWYDRRVLDQLPERIDALIVDGPPNLAGQGSRSPALAALRDRLADGAVILVDDTNRLDERRMVDDWVAAGAVRVTADQGRFIVLEFVGSASPSR